jgi:outer membrane protein
MNNATKNNVTMKKYLSIAILTLVFTLGAVLSSNAQSQKNAFVDTEYILDNIPEYHDAQDELDEWSAKWQKEIETLYNEIKALYKKYQAEKVLLPDDIKKEREDEIVKKEAQMKDLQKKYFGPEGELFKKRQELVQPIQEKIYNAIEELAQENHYTFVFDKAGGMTILYGNPKYDISDDVLDKVGEVMQTNTRDQRK